MIRNLKRRQLIVSSTGAGIAAMVLPAQAQGPERIVPAEVGRLHRVALQAMAKELNGKSPATKEGLQILVKLLEKLKVIKNPEAQLLMILIDVLFSAPLDGMVSKVQPILDDAIKTAGAVVVAIVSVARDSAENVIKTLQKVDPKRALAIVQADVAGALEGAGTAASLKLSGPAMVVAILGGAVAGSLNEYLKLR